MTEPRKAFNRPKCAEHGNKTLYVNRKDALGATTGHLNQKRIRVYPCEAHKGYVHMTKEDIKYHLTQKRRPRYL